MKAGWSKAKLDSVCHEITDGSHFSPKTTTSGYPYITVRDIENDRVDFYNCKFISEVEYKQLLKNGCKPNNGDVLFSKDGTVGKVSLVDYEKDFVVLSSLAIIRPKKEIVNSAFLKYMLQSPVFLDEAIGKKTGVAIRRIILRNLKSIFVPTPAISEQQRIVAILDQAFEGIAKARANAEQNLQNARALFESHLQSVFTQRGEGWVESKLGEVVELDKTLHKPNNALPYVGMEDIESDTGNFIGSKEPRKVKSSTFHFNDSHVLYGRLRPYLNKVLLPDFEGHCSTEVFPLLPSLNLDRNFLFYWLTLNSTKEKINATCTGARMPRANMNDVLTFDFSYPSLNIQKIIVENLKELSKETQRLEALYQRKIACLDELKKSLLQQAFAGEL